MKTGKAIMQLLDALTAAKYLLLVGLGFMEERDVVQNVPSLSAGVILKVGKAEAPPVLSGNAILLLRSSKLIKEGQG